jgi:hypothetical protein
VSVVFAVFHPAALSKHYFVQPWEGTVAIGVISEKLRATVAKFLPDMLDSCPVEEIGRIQWRQTQNCVVWLQDDVGLDVAVRQGDRGELWGGFGEALTPLGTAHRLLRSVALEKCFLELGSLFDAMNAAIFAQIVRFVGTLH